jgi:hypothetical protein
VSSSPAPRKAVPVSDASRAYQPIWIASSLLRRVKQSGNTW